VEFSHPLNSGDPEDFSLAIGDTVGFQIHISDSSLGEGYWPSQAQTTNDIVIAGPPELPVGGELSSQHLISASTLIIATLVAITGYTILGRKKLQ
jgi:hypothetical protein